MSSRKYFRLRRQLIDKARRLRDALLAVNKDHKLITALTAAITALIDELRSVMAFAEIRKLLAGAGLVVVMQGAATGLQAQSFKNPLINPFGLQDSYSSAWIDAADIDGDGDLDIFVGAYSDYSTILYYENIGTVNQPALAAPEADPFGIQADVELVMPEFADIDNDGDLDLFITFDYGLAFFENTGNATAPEFAAPVADPFGIAAQQSYMFRPTFADLDDDGDLDLLTGSAYDDYTYMAGVLYFENTGSASEPQFAEAVENPFGPTNVYSGSFPTLADLDDDGDLDLLLGELFEYYSGSYLSKLIYFENTGDAKNPQFSNREENPFGLSGGIIVSYPCFADMDNDGDPDLFIGQISEEDYDYGNFLYFENTELSGTKPLINPEVFLVYPNPASGFIEIRTVLDIELVEIIDAAGRRYSISSDFNNINIEQLTTGLTVFHAVAADGSVFVDKVAIVR